MRENLRGRIHREAVPEHCEGESFKAMPAPLFWIYIETKRAGPVPYLTYGRAATSAMRNKAAWAYGHQTALP